MFDLYLTFPIHNNNNKMLKFSFNNINEFNYHFMIIYDNIINENIIWIDKLFYLY